MADEKPTLLLIHGAWHTIAAYQDFLDTLSSKGYRTVAPELPSGGEKTPSDPTASDIRHIAAVAESLIEAGKEIVVIAHSYGGIIASEAFSNLGVKSRSAKGLPGGVRLVIYVAAFMLDEGQNSEMGASIDMVPWCEYQGDYKVLTPGVDVGSVFYPDLPKEEQQKWLSRITKHPKECSFYAPKKTCYNETDIAFIYCELDQAFPYFAQKAVVDGTKGRGVTVQEATLSSGHFPSLSMPGVLADTVLQFIEP